MLDDTATPTSSAPPTPRLSARPQVAAPPEPSAIRYPVPHILRFLGGALPHAAPAAVKEIKVYALALLRRSVADAGVPVVQDADYCELVLGGARATLALLTEHHAQDVHYQNMRIAITKQIQLLERNWMQRAAQALARDQTKLMQICYKSLGPTHRKVPDNIRLLWIQHRAFYVIKMKELAYYAGLGRVQEFEQIWAKLYNNVGLWTISVVEWYRAGQPGSEEKAGPALSSELDAVMTDEANPDVDEDEDGPEQRDGECFCGFCHSCEVNLGIRPEWEVDVPDCSELYNRLQTLQLGS